MVDKTLFDQMMRRIKHGGLQVNYWDGSSKTYGPDKPQVTLTIHDAKVVREILKNMSLGFGEAYMDGRVDVDGDIRDLGKLITTNVASLSKLISSNLTAKLQRNHRTAQKGQIQHHYDLGNDFYQLWLDTSMTYSCAYFKTPDDTLEQAQQQKIEHLLRKLQLKPGMTMLDIGSGWGQLLIKAAQDYGISGLGVTLSREQHELSNQRAKELGLDKQIRFELINYQDLPKRKVQYDRVISVGMFEHVGRDNQAHYFKAAQQLLAPGGISVLHTISAQDGGGNDPWMDRYIFPGGWIPDIANTIHQMSQHDLKLLDYESLRLHYAMTLDEWLARFENHREKVVDRYGERFYRMWRLYLGMCAANFRYGSLDLSQFVFSNGINNDLPLTREFLYR